MSKKLREVLEKQLESTEVPKEELEKIEKEGEKFVKLVKKALRGRGEVFIGGSLAKGTLINKKVEAIVMGCTEIPIALSQDDVPIKLFDSSQILAEETVNFALKSKEK